MAIAPRGTLVKSPSCPDTTRYGFLSAVEPTTNVDSHWMASGIEWEDFLCSPGVTGFIDECPPESFTKPAENSSSFCHADPFLIVGSYKCPPVGRQADEAFEIARQRLLKWEGRQLERTLWTGEVANGSGLINPSFAYGNSECGITPVDLNPAGAVDPVEALALLEAALGEAVGGCGVVHVSYANAAYFETLRLLDRQEDSYFTPTGLRIVLGQGYPGSGPGNVAAAAGETWMFGTGPLVMTRSPLYQVPDNIQEGVNRMVNDVEIRAERFYAVGFSCALFAVRSILCGGCP